MTAVCVCVSARLRAEETTAESAMAALRASRRGKLPLVDGEGRLAGLATRTLFRDNARMPFGGAWLAGWVGGWGRAQGCCQAGCCRGLGGDAGWDFFGGPTWHLVSGGSFGACH
jgi:hypothetical protein